MGVGVRSLDLGTGGRLTLCQREALLLAARALTMADIGGGTACIRVPLAIAARAAANLGIGTREEAIVCIAILDLLAHKRQSHDNDPPVFHSRR